MNRNRKMNIQRFAGTEVEATPRTRIYQKELKQVLTVIFEHESYFGDFLPLQALDGVSDSDTAFSVKSGNTAVTINEYSTDANTAFGTGTGSTSRFGARTEIKHTDIDVPYSWTWAFHEGIDRHTVNDDFEQVLADRTEDEANAQVELFNQHESKYISDSAGKTIAATAADVNSLTKAELVSIFDQLSAYFVNAKVRRNLTKIAKVKSSIYNAIINNELATTAKGSAVNIDQNTITTFKGFRIQELPDDAFQTNDAIYASVAGVGMAFTGIVTTRAIESEDFDGTALQGAGKAGEYIPDVNKAAVVKVTLTKTGA